MPSWRMVVEDELGKLKRFREFLRAEDKEVFDDLLNQCRLYASYGGSMASPVKEIQLLMSILFGQHKRLMELEKRFRVIDHTTRTGLQQETETEPTSRVWEPTGSKQVSQSSRVTTTRAGMISTPEAGLN